jgi:hypothetical protein
VTRRPMGVSICLCEADVLSSEDLERTIGPDTSLDPDGAHAAPAVHDSLEQHGATAAPGSHMRTTRAPDAPASRIAHRISPACQERALAWRSMCGQTVTSTR